MRAATAPPDPSEHQFGAPLILTHDQAAAHARAACCFAALPDLLSIAFWARLRDPGPGPRCRLTHDSTWFWFTRTHPDQDPSLTLADVEDDRAAAACFRLVHAHPYVTQLLAAEYGLDDSPCELVFHRSGFAYLVRDAERLVYMTYGERAELGRAAMAPFIHPVWPAHPSAHQSIAWAGAVWTNLFELALFPNSESDAGG